VEGLDPGNVEEAVDAGVPVVWNWRHRGRETGLSILNSESRVEAVERFYIEIR